jgi:hypothetical protein
MLVATSVKFLDSHQIGACANTRRSIAPNTLILRVFHGFY